MTTDDALTAALEISELMIRDTDDARDDYGALRFLIMPRLSDLDTSRETQLIKNMIQLADDHFDF